MAEPAAMAALREREVGMDAFRRKIDLDSIALCNNRIGWGVVRRKTLSPFGLK
ncbi:hypothetical protein GCM10027343_18860 [Noviherbaspirillum agri]